MGKKSRSVGVTRAENFTGLEDLKQIQNISSLNPINLDYCGREQCTPGYSFGPFVRTSYVLHMVLSGKGKLSKDGKIFPVKEKQAFLIYPKEETVYQADPEEPWEYMWIGFHGFRADEMMRRAGFLQLCPVIDCPNMDKMKVMMDRMLGAIELTYVNDLIRTSALYGLMALLMGENRENVLDVKEEAGADHIYVQTAVNLLLSSYQTGIRVEDVARAIGISRNYLASIFKKEMNASPQEFLMNFRMEKAASLLCDTQSPINAIAYEVGYVDALSFSKAFKRRYGMSPSEFREKRPKLAMRDKKGTYVSDYPL